MADPADPEPMITKSARIAMGYPFAQKRPPVPQLLVFDKPTAL